MRSALLYLVLVGVPTLGVLATLRTGERIDAPSHVGGRWRVAQGDGCALRPGDEIEVVQSGEHLSVTWPGGARARGHVRDGRLDVPRPDDGRVCPGCSPAPARLTAAVPPGRAEVTRIAGVEVLCEGCAGRHFAWERVSRPAPAVAPAH